MYYFIYNYTVSLRLSIFDSIWQQFCKKKGSGEKQPKPWLEYLWKQAKSIKLYNITEINLNYQYS